KSNYYRNSSLINLLLSELVIRLRLPRSFHSLAMTPTFLVIANPSHFLTDEAIAFYNSVNAVTPL
ncbi:hypothetical protein KAX35_07795, partial [candidate division WOR-3 bacterium]|nr:hypothetical protein [candidate division WOR-3 bacterium]